MPFAQNGGVRIYHKVEGKDGLPPIVLLNSIGTEMAMWDRAIPYLLDHFLAFLGSPLVVGECGADIHCVRDALSSLTVLLRA